MIWFGYSFIKFCKSFINLIKLFSARTCSSARVRLARTLRMQPAKPARLDPALVLTPAGSSPPILREIRRFPPSSCLPRATRGYPRQRRGDAGIAAGAGSGPSARSTQADPSRPCLSLELELFGCRALAPPAAAAHGSRRRSGPEPFDAAKACGSLARRAAAIRATRTRCAPADNDAQAGRSRTKGGRHRTGKIRRQARAACSWDMHTQAGRPGPSARK